jgi:hypothetical protein
MDNIYDMPTLDPTSTLDILCCSDLLSPYQLAWDAILVYYCTSADIPGLLETSLVFHHPRNTIRFILHAFLQSIS